MKRGFFIVRTYDSVYCDKRWYEESVMLTREMIEAYALNRPGVDKEYPFDTVTAVYKVAGKMFLLMNDNDRPVRFNVKCEPLYALELRSLYDSVIAGYHMNKKHWNTVRVDGEVDDIELYTFIDDSYALVVAGLSKKVRASLLKYSGFD